MLLAAARERTPNSQLDNHRSDSLPSGLLGAAKSPSHKYQSLEHWQPKLDCLVHEILRQRVFRGLADIRSTKAAKLI